ncbi:MAG: hypothetical protein C6I05_05335 [Epsilonproteobacteria bacterium]|nr:hypothetical protein [Campylobacterota bacterium]
MKRGVWYGRFRINSFLWDWKREYPEKRRDNWSLAIGGSLIYKTPYFRGFGFTLGVYTSQNPWHMEGDEVSFIKSGKDTFSRYKVKHQGDFGITTFAQAYLEYRREGIEVKVGRQIFESMLTSGNDSKMIPNTFEGYSLTLRRDSPFTLKCAYLTRQKLRHHEEFHDVLTFRDSGGDSWGNNDDSAVNKNLSYENFVAAGKDPNHRLIVFQLEGSGERVKTTLNYTAVPTVLALGGVEVEYRDSLNGFTIAPALRYIRQWDRGAEDLHLPVANLKGDGRGYSNPYSLESWLFAGKVQIQPQDPIWSLALGYSWIADRADIVAPWRGFPTGGFTRAMGQYNWYAGTRSLMVQGVANLDRAKVVAGTQATLRYVVEDFDDSKPAVPADSRVINLDLLKRVQDIPGLSFKFRMAVVRGPSDHGEKLDPSYNEYRLEMNYLF